MDKDTQTFEDKKTELLTELMAASIDGNDEKLMTLSKKLEKLFGKSEK